MGTGLTKLQLPKSFITVLGKIDVVDFVIIFYYFLKYLFIFARD